MKTEDYQTQTAANLEAIKGIHLDLSALDSLESAAAQKSTEAMIKDSIHRNYAGINRLAEIERNSAALQRTLTGLEQTATKRNINSKSNDRYGTATLLLILISVSIGVIAGALSMWAVLNLLVQPVN